VSINTKHGKTVRQLLLDEGYEILEWRISRHYRIRLRKHGTEFAITVSISPSDFRVLNQIRTQLRQQLERAKQYQLAKVAVTQ